MKGESPPKERGRPFSAGPGEDGSLHSSVGVNDSKEDCTCS